jgi:hypothetical protein
MKCPECGAVRKKNLKEDGELRCGCGYQFIFQPGHAQGMTDAKFFNLFRRAGAGGRFYFTFPQIYTAWCQQDAEERMSLLRKRLAGIGILMLALCIGCFLLFGGIGALPCLILLIVPWLLVRRHHRQLPPDLGVLKKLVRQWQAGHGGGDEMLLIRPILHEPPPDFPEKDLFAYGVEQILLVERPLLVDLLVRNGFHADQNTLVVSRDGYPAYLVPRVQKILKENSSLPVYLLHDAGEAGMTTARKNKLAGRTVIDLGIRPEHLKKMQFLKELQLERKGYKMPVDILPYPVLAALCGQALCDKSTFSEVLEQWNALCVRKNPFWMQIQRTGIGKRIGKRIGKKKTNGQGA